MKVLLEIKDNKAVHLLDVLNSLTYVKAILISYGEEVSDKENFEGDSKKAIFKNLSQGFKDLAHYKKGKLKTTKAKDFLNEV